MTEEFKLKLIGFMTVVYSTGFMAIAALGYLIEENWHLLRTSGNPART